MVKQLRQAAAASFGGCVLAGLLDNVAVALLMLAVMFILLVAADNQERR